MLRISTQSRHLLATRYLHSSSVTSSGLKGNGVIGLRREVKSRWERRAAISPSNVSTLVRQGMKVVVQPSTLRVFPNEEYEKAGAVISEDLSEASVIIGVKEVPIHQMISNRSYLYFSHTIKAQEYNMPALDSALQKNLRLIDYEKMVDAEGKRVIAFGDFAGKAGMVDILVGLGDRMLALGYYTPFVHMGFAHSYECTADARAAVSGVGRHISRFGVPAKFGPLVFVFTGSGNVSSGAQQMFEELPHEYVTPDELREVCASGDRYKVYATVVSAKDYAVPKKEGKKFDKVEFYSNPGEYKSVFHTKIAPYASVIVNGLYWDAKYPRLITNEQLQQMHSYGACRLLAVADISADPEGSLQFVPRCTSIDSPFMMWDPASMKETKSDKDGNILIMSVDNLPAEFPREASEHFGNKLTPYLSNISHSDASRPFADQLDLNPVVKGAVITAHGKLTPNFEYIKKLRVDRRKQQRHVLVLGSGMVAGPLVRYLLEQNYHVTIASADHDAAVKLTNKNPHAQVANLDVEKENDKLRDLVGKHDIVVSFVPAPLHPQVARVCIEKKKNMVTASYISPEMQSLHQRAVEAGITILNEIGLDPGIDHLSAKKIIDQAHDDGGRVVSFKSYCGGLPAPEFSDNPLGYKFSWSPMGVMRAGRNPARFLEDGKVVEVPGEDLFQSATALEVLPGFNLECLPNRNSLVYASLYDIPESTTVFRGTLRYKGFSRTMSALAQAGFLNDAPVEGENWALVTHTLLQSLGYDGSISDLRNRAAMLLSQKSKLSALDQAKALESMAWLGLFNVAQSVQKSGAHAPIELLCDLMLSKLTYAPDERDMVIMHHDVVIAYEKYEERKLATMIQYGEPGGDTAMARTVGLPTAIATKLILEGKINRRGVIAPITPAEYVPTLTELEALGITLKESIITLSK